MNKNAIMFSAAAAVIMTGCGGGGSSTTSTVPSYATQEAEITSAATVESVTQTMTSVLDVVAVPTSATKSINRTSLKDKVIVSKVDKKLNATFGMRTKAKIANLKKTMAVTTCEPITDEITEVCSESGTEGYTYTQALNAAGECIATFSIFATNCHDIGSETFGDTTWSWDDTVNGSMTDTSTSIPDGQGSFYYVSDVWIENFSASGMETDTVVGQDPITYNYKEDFDYSSKFTEGYTLAEGVFSYTDKFNIVENGTINWNFGVDGQNDITLAYRSDMESSYDFSQTSKMLVSLDGYIDLRYSIGTAAEENYSFAAAALNLGYDNSVSGTSSSTIDGKIGSSCTGGMIAVDTNRTIVDNYSDAFELPNDGLMNLTGAAGTTASLEYFEGNAGTYATATVGEESKTYNTNSELYGEACQGEFLNPMY